MLCTYYFGCSRSSDVDGIKIFDKDDQATKHCLWPGHLYHVLQEVECPEINDCEYGNITKLPGSCCPFCGESVLVS